MAQVVAVRWRERAAVASAAAVLGSVPSDRPSAVASCLAEGPRLATRHWAASARFGA